MTTRGGYQLLGLCYCDRKVYTVEKQIHGYHNHLVVYQMNSDSGSLILMDCMDVETRGYLARHFEGILVGNTIVYPLSIATDRHSHRVFFPVRHGVLVARLEGDKLLKERILHSVDVTYDLAVIPLDTLYVCDWDGKAVRIIDGIRDTVTGTLETPVLTDPDMRPYSVAVQGDNIVVGYGILGFPLSMLMSGLGRSERATPEFSVAVYHHGSLTPIRILHAPDTDVGVFPPYLTAGSEGHALLVHNNTATVCVININGDVYHANHKIKVNTDSQIYGCVVVN